MQQKGTTVEKIPSSQQDNETSCPGLGVSDGGPKQRSLIRNPSLGSESLETPPRHGTIKDTEEEHSGGTGQETTGTDAVSKPSNIRTTSSGTASLGPSRSLGSSHSHKAVGKMAVPPAVSKDESVVVNLGSASRPGVTENEATLKSWHDEKPQDLPPDLPSKTLQDDEMTKAKTQAEVIRQHQKQVDAGLQTIGEKEVKAPSSNPPFQDATTPKEGSQQEHQFDKCKINTAEEVAGLQPHGDALELSEPNLIRSELTPGAVAVPGIASRNAPFVRDLEAPSPPASQRPGTTAGGDSHENLIQAVLVSDTRETDDVSDIVHATVINKWRIRAIFVCLVIITVAITVAVVVPLTTRGAPSLPPPSLAPSPPPSLLSTDTISITLGDTPNESAEIQQYDPGVQDIDSDFTVEDNGTTLVLNGNTWVALNLGAEFTMTRGTVLEFDFQSSVQGESHLIFFDSDLDSSTDNENEESFRFQLYGSKSVRRAISAFEDYTEVAPDVRHYVIPMGQFYTNREPFLVFASAQDMLLPAECRFSNIHVYERELAGFSVNFDDFDLERYDPGAQDMDNDAERVINGTALLLRSNTWTAIDLGSEFVIRNNTLLEFDFQSLEQGELHGIFFDNDLDYSTDGDIEHRFLFQLYGKQSLPSAISAFENYPELAPGIRHYVIPVGQFYTGREPYLVFVNDMDEVGSARSIFSNVVIFESFTILVNFGSPGTIQRYEPGGQDMDNNFSIADDGATLIVEGNTWVAVDLGPEFTMTQDTVLEFDFQSSDQAEIHFVCFDNDLDFSTNGPFEDSFCFQLYGVQLRENAIATYENYAEVAPDMRHYVIPVGQFYTSREPYLVFANDLDAGVSAQGRFSNVFIYDSRGAL